MAQMSADQKASGELLTNRSFYGTDFNSSDLCDPRDLWAKVLGLVLFVCALCASLRLAQNLLQRTQAPLVFRSGADGNPKPLG